MGPRYTLCEPANHAKDVGAYNQMVTGWGGIEIAAPKLPGRKQRTLFDNAGAE
jgi:putative DNA methylase